MSDEKDGSTLNRRKSEEKQVELRTRSLELRGQDAEWDNGEKIAQGRESAKNYLANHIEVTEEVEKKVREAVKEGK